MEKMIRETMQKLFGETAKKGAFLAPMAGFTDLAFRQICAEYGALYSVTEMVSCKALDFRNERTKNLYEYQDVGHPQGIQLFGSEPLTIARVIEETVNELPYAFIDFNMACPVPKIFKNNEGSALMQNPALAGEIVRSAVKVSKKPFSVKIRLGVSRDRINACEFAKLLEDAGASFVTVHGRTRDMYYSGKAMTEEIAKVKASVSIPVIANGDIFSPEDAKRVLTETNCDAIMVGRGALGNPYLFRQISDYLQTGTYEKNMPPSEIVSLIQRQFRMMLDYKPEKVALMEMRKHAHRYLKGLYGASSVKDRINRANSEAEFFACLEELKKER